MRQGSLHFFDLVFRLKMLDIIIVVNGGGIEGSRSRLWKYALHQWTQREDLKIVVCHFPPGTSKWNKIEHQVFETSARTGAANP